MSKILNQLASLSDPAPGTTGTAIADAVDVSALTARVLELKPQAADHVAELGNLLKAVKAELGHGSFVAWLADVVHMTRSTATKYMRAAELINIDVLEPLGVEKLYLVRSLENVHTLTPESTLPGAPGQPQKTLLAMSTRELRSAVQALSPGRPTRRPMRRDLVQRYRHLRDELQRVVHQLSNGDDAARARFRRSMGASPERAAQILGQLP